MVPSIALAISDFSCKNSKKLYRKTAQYYYLCGQFFENDIE